MWHLLTHTAGLTYGFLHAGPSTRCTATRVRVRHPDGSTSRRPPNLGLMPLVFEPGTAWNYSVATDVLGRLVEVVTGQSLDKAFADRVLEPLGMVDTTWWVEPERATGWPRCTPCTRPRGRPCATTRSGRGLSPPRMLSGGGGLVSSAADYERFTRMLLRGGELDGKRLLGTRTVRYMGNNHLPGGGLLSTLGRGQFAETAYDGIGFGLGFGVLVDPVAMKVHASEGEMTWGGLASTAFWVDPHERLTAHFFTQLMPSSTYPVRGELRQLVYSALVD